MLKKAQREQRGEIEKAQTAEQRAADAYAAALAGGDDAAEERAEKALKQASEAMTQAAQGKRGLNTLMATLTTEIEKLDVAFSDAKRIADYRQNQLNAARLLWAERLDKAAQDFAKVATQFTATRKRSGVAIATWRISTSLCRPQWVPDTSPIAKSLKWHRQFLSRSC